LITKSSQIQSIGSDKKIDIKVAVILLIISLFTLVIYINLFGMAGRIITILLSLFFASVIYLFLRNKLFKKIEYGCIKSKFISINILFYLLFIIVIYSSSTYLYKRPLEFFILISFMSLIILAEINLVEGHAQKTLVLLHIILIASILRINILYEFPGLLGIDPPYHIHLTNTIITSGHIPSTENFYFDYPLSYISTAVSGLILSLDYKNSLIIAVGIPMIISILFTYLIGSTLFNYKIGTIAALFTSAYPFHILYSYILIPMSIGFAFFSIIIYLIMVNKLSYKILTLIFLPALLFSHPLVLLVFFFTIITLSSGSFFYNAPNKKIVPFFSIRLLIIVVIARWMYSIVNAPLFDDIVKSAIYVFTTFEHPKLASSSSFVTVSGNLLDESLNTFGFALLIMLATIGIFYLIRMKKNNQISGFIITSFLMFIVTTGSAAMGLGIMLPQRWLIFLGFFIVILAAFGLYKMPLNYVIRYIIVFILIFFMITTTFSNMDNPIYAKTEAIRYAYMESEIRAGNTITSNYNGSILTDLTYVGYFRSIARDINYIQIPLMVPKNKSTLIIRKYILDDPFYIASVDAGTVVSLNEEDRSNLIMIANSNNKIYTNGQVNAYSILPFHVEKQNATYPL